MKTHRIRTKPYEVRSLMDVLMLPNLLTKINLDNVFTSCIIMSGILGLVKSRDSWPN